jgi:hypothetical protein
VTFRGTECQRQCSVQPICGKRRVREWGAVQRGESRETLRDEVDARGRMPASASHPSFTPSTSHEEAGPEAPRSARVARA